MTSFFFTFFKVFLNGCLGLFVVTLPRLLKIQRADKVFFHFFLTPRQPPNPPSRRREQALVGASGAPVHAVTEVLL
jgi:hypothetical protein